MSIKLKELEGQRLYRALRYFFKKRKFQFSWTNQQTSYFDGKKVHIIYDVQRPHLRHFTPAEERIIRYGHAYHEVGHYLFDQLDTYINWLNDNSTRVKEEWKDDWSAHKKYPKSWLQFFGNFGLDGRMEYLLKTYYSPTTDYLNFVNEYWVFKEDFQEKCGVDPLTDFRTLYGCLVLDVQITGDFHEDAVELLESQADLLAQINQQNSTKDCLLVISQIMENTWPTILQWLEQSNEDVSNDNLYSDDMTQGQWGDSEEESQEHTQAAREIEENQVEQPEEEKDEDQDISDLESLIRAMQREMKKDENEAEKQAQDEAEYSGSYVSGGEEAKFAVKPLEQEANPELYQKQASKLRPAIKKMEKELQALVMPVGDRTIRNQSKGKIMPHSVWRATHTNDMNVYQQKVKGRPGKDVFISLMADVSGSTHAALSTEKRVYEEIRDALITVIEATQAINIGSKAFAFTSDFDVTNIFKLKTRRNELTQFNCGLIGALSPLWGNRDAVALRYLIDDTKKENAEVKIAFLISDGEPNFFANEDEETIRQLVKKAKKDNIHVICIFVGNDERGLACAKRMYGRRVIHAKKGIAREVQQQIKLIVQ